MCSSDLGSCTALADKIEGHLRKAGYGDADIYRFAVPEAPKEGGIVVVLPGTSKTLKPILLLGHLDVVVAKREDWTRDPYKMVEENGYFYEPVNLGGTMERPQNDLEPKLKAALTKTAVRTTVDIIQKATGNTDPNTPAGAAGQILKSFFGPGPK